MDPTLSARLRDAIRDVPDFPQPGILFRDITTLLTRPKLVAEALDALWEPFAGQVEYVAGIESRGFIVGATLAVRQSLPFVPLRKPGKLPSATWREEYKLEYGTDALELHRDALPAQARVLLVDDLLATGGTAAAAMRLVERTGSIVVGLAFLAELGFLHGRNKLGAARVHSLIRYDD